MANGHIIDAYFPNIKTLAMYAMFEVFQKNTKSDN